jgi:hypothetical protein
MSNPSHAQGCSPTHALLCRIKTLAFRSFFNNLLTAYILQLSLINIFSGFGHFVSESSRNLVAIYAEKLKWPPSEGCATAAALCTRCST